eukprot:7526643-Pyramimonas_sp.AAC.1
MSSRAQASDCAIPHAVAECFTPHVYEADTALFNLPESPCRNMYIVVTGAVIMRVETFKPDFKRVHCAYAPRTPHCVPSGVPSGVPHLSLIHI